MSDNPSAPRPPLARFLEEKNDPLFRILRWGIVVTFTIMVLAALLQVISRYFFNYPLGWTGELAQITMIWFSFLAVAILARRRRLMRVDAFLVQLSPRWRAVANASVNLSSAFFIGWMAYLSIRLMDLAGQQVSTALKIPYPYIYLSITIGLFSATIYFVCVGIADLKMIKDSAGADKTGRRQMED